MSKSNLLVTVIISIYILYSLSRLVLDVTHGATKPIYPRHSVSGIKMAVPISKLECNFDEPTRILSSPELKLYYDRQCSIGRIAFEELRRRPNHICQIYEPDEERLTNLELRLQAIRVACFFESLSLKQDDIVGFCARNTPYAVCVPVACFFKGIACHAISPLHDKGTSKKLFNISKPKVIFCDGQDIELIRFASSDFETKICTISNHIKGVPSIFDLLKPTGDEHKFEPAELENGPEQNLFLLCTSGSTGVPKAVTVPNSLHFYQSWNMATGEDIQFINTTFDWATALMSLLGSVINGITRIITDKPVTADYFMEIVQKYKVTITFQTPPNTTMIIKSPNISAEKLDSIRYFIIGGGSSSPILTHETQKFLRNGEIINAYGSTELNTGLTRNFYSENKVGALGRILPGLRVRIVGDNGENLKRGEIGEMFIARSDFWCGYYKNPEATNEVYDDDGWLRTGDLGYIDEDNYIFMVGRKKELLKYKAMHYYPKDIEDVIIEIPGVKEVCVFGIEDEFVGEKAAAAVVKVEGTSLTEKDVIDYVKQKIDAEHKQLHGGVKFFKEIPKNTNNKYDRNASKNMFLGK